jgi:hypothetical membrane protein
MIVPTLPFRWVTQPVLGAACWSLTLVYFAAQPIVAAAWEPPYSFSTNSISDLGNSGCGSFEHPDGSFSDLCSPRHALMNMVFIVVGLMTALGAFLTRRTWPQRPSAMVGLILIAVAGAGAIMVGLAPADENLVLHGVGALLQVPANVGLLLLGVASWRSHRRIAVFSLVCGSVGTAASVLWVSGSHLGLGSGGMERLTIDPLTIWATVIGTVLLWRYTRGRSLNGRRSCLGDEWLNTRAGAHRRRDTSPARQPLTETTLGRRAAYSCSTSRPDRSSECGTASSGRRRGARCAWSRPSRSAQRPPVFPVRRARDRVRHRPRASPR